MSIPKKERPTTYKPATASGWNAVTRLRRRKNIHVIDAFREQLAELAIIKQPSLIRLPKPDIASAVDAFIKTREARNPLERQGCWVFYPWMNTLVHVLDEPEFHTVRSSRNADLITFDEQQKFYDTTVGVAGLSVGSNIALTIVLQGGARHIRLADFDSLDLSNTNRLLAGVHQLGLPKTTIIARTIWEINPFAKIDIFDEGLHEENIADFVAGLDIIVDEMDQFTVKQQLRELARKHRIPLLSAADNGDRSTIDIERHDLRGKTDFFLGRLGTTSVAKFKRLQGDKAGTIREITKLIGPEQVPARLQASLPKIGDSLVSVPQLGGTALMGAAVVTYCIRKIVSGEPLPSGRSHVCLDEKLVPDYHAPSTKKQRTKATTAFAKKFGL